jgi:hypothetical protein
MIAVINSTYIKRCGSGKMKIVCDFCGVSYETYKDNRCEKGQPGTYGAHGWVKAKDTGSG